MLASGLCQECHATTVAGRCTPRSRRRRVARFGAGRYHAVRLARWPAEERLARLLFWKCIMPIQFRCSGCGQPIEVDDEHAGKMAACPYCSRVVAVPMASSLEEQPIAGARPAASPGQAETGWSPPPPEAARPLDAREQTGRKYGRYALVCLALAGISMVVLLVLAFPALKEIARVSATQPGQITGSQLEEVEEIARGAQTRPAVMTLSCIAQLLIVIALALSITSVVQCRRNNVAGIVALVLSALLTACVCCSALLNVAGAMST